MHVLLPVVLMAHNEASAADYVQRPWTVAVEEGERVCESGDRIGYALYYPKFKEPAGRQQCPAVVITHGFMRNYSFHAANAKYMAERGIIVLTPNMSELFGGGRSRQRNAQNTANHIKWLARRSEAEGDALYGLIDPKRIGLAGHSAGGAVSFQAAVISQASPTPAAALCLLDAVPWHGTIKSAASFRQIPFCSLRSEPSRFNADAEVLKLLRAMPFAVEDVLICGASHVDPENPSSTAAHIFAGGVHPDKQALYQKLMYLFFRDALGAPVMESERETYSETLLKLQEEGRIVVKLISP